MLLHYHLIIEILLQLTRGKRILVLNKIKTINNHFIVSDNWHDLARIKEANYNIAILNRNLDPNINIFLDRFIESDFSQSIYACCKTNKFREIFQSYLLEYSSLYRSGYESFLDDIQNIVNNFAVISNSNNIEIFFDTVKTTKCPRYHYDQNDLRLICTYKGQGTIWLNNDNVNFDKLGHKDNLQISKDISKINKVNQQDIAILKGKKYPNNLYNAIVHKSPDLIQGEKRLLLRLDSIREHI